MIIRVAAAQVALGKGSYRKALDDAISLIRRAAALGAQVVCLPEHWLLEYREQGYAAPKEMSELARSERICLISGANYARVQNGSSSEIRICSFVFGPGGNAIGRQDKVHLFHGEGEVANPGDGYEVLDSPLGGIGITICYDNVFPEAARTLALKGADLLFVPSRIVAEGLDPWILYLRTRALENRIPVIAPNVFHPPRYLGGSVIIDLAAEKPGPVVLPKIVASGKSGELVIIADVNIDQARELRRERLLDRRPGAYVGLQS
jgi:predicted amidohydrolase